jgi:hypothetical protein
MNRYEPVVQPDSAIIDAKDIFFVPEDRVIKRAHDFLINPTRIAAQIGITLSLGSSPRPYVTEHLFMELKQERVAENPACA